MVINRGNLDCKFSNYGLNKYVRNIIKEKNKLNLHLVYEYVVQEEKKNWSKLYRKKTIDDFVIEMVEDIDAKDKYKFLIGKNATMQ